MGGLIAQYALRDMEIRRANNPSAPAHDTRLFLSHDAPHQGANVPLGFQHLVRETGGIVLLPGLTLSDVNPDLKQGADLLNAAATMQLLTYQTTVRGSSVHDLWQSEYSQMGLPQQCRSVATSNGSECGRSQALSPYSEILRLQGSGYLSKQISQQIRSLTIQSGAAIGAIAGAIAEPVWWFAVTAGFAVFFLGNYNGELDFIVHALPSQQALNIYHGRLILRKKILGINIRVGQYKGDVDSGAGMLAYDSAPGSFYDINVFTGTNIVESVRNNFPIPLSAAYLSPRFTFIPTTSALNIGGGNVNLAPQDLTRSYSGTAPPAAPLNSPFANFITAGRENESHILWTALNSNWAFNEMQNTPATVSCLAFCQALPVVKGPDSFCPGATATYAVGGLPPGTTVQWDTQPRGVLSPPSSTNTTFTVGAATATQVVPVRITARLVSACGIIPLIPRDIIANDPGSLTLTPNRTGPICRYGTVTLTATGRNTNTNYRWYLNNALQTGRNDQPTFVMTVDANQTLRVEATSRCPGGDTVSSANFEPNLNTGCNLRPAAARAVEAYPNPTRDGLTLHRTAAVGNASAAPLTVRLYDAYSRVRYEGPLGAADQRVSTRGLAPGVYFLHVVQQGRVLDRQQIEIQP